MASHQVQVNLVFFHDMIFAGVQKSKAVALDVKTGKPLRQYSKADGSIGGIVVMPGQCS